MSRSIITALGFLCVTAIVIANIVVTNPAQVQVETTYVIQGVDEWHDVECLNMYGDLEWYTIPVPGAKGLSGEYRDEYLEYAGQQFCDAIVDKTEYVSDVGIITE